MRLNTATWVGRTALLATATIAIAIAVALLATPVSAQSDDETAGRIVARLLEDGRVEFGWQPTGGARVLPRQRYFPADATVDRWLRSSPVEVGGAEIGRINARLLSDGRIEFGFTPTDGERIAPRARYFPADARVGRWLRSTEITIGPPAATSGYTAVSAGGNHTCAIRAGSGEIACWGHNGRGQSDAPAGRFRAVSAGGDHTCAIRASDGAIKCWGSNHTAYWNSETESYDEIYSGKSDAPESSFSAVSAGYDHTCAIRASDDAIACWGDNEYGKSDAPAGSFSAVSVGTGYDGYTCAIRTSGEIACWGRNNEGQTDAPPGSYSAIAAGDWHTCAIRTSGEIVCWGRSREGQSDAPEGSFSTVSASDFHTCANRAGTGAIECWGGRTAGSYPTGSYSAVSAGWRHTCAIRASDGAIEYWGNDAYGEATPPSE